MYKHDDGAPVRSFKSVEEMDETLVDNWNRVVRPQDRVYHLGDVVMHRRCLPIMGRLHGRKKLVRGNHDLFKLSDYTPYFEDVYGCYLLKDIILTHIPVHAQQLTARFGTNVHGHLHTNNVMRWRDVADAEGYWEADPKYFNVSVEQINYTPISLEELRMKIAKQQC